MISLIQTLEEGGTEAFFVHALTSADVVVVNSGLHGTYGNDNLLRVLVNVSAIGQAPRVIWAESPHQHFDTQFGEYNENRECDTRYPSSCDPAKKLCLPLGTRKRHQSNADMDKLFEITGAAGVIPVIPIEMLYMQRWDTHPDFDGVGSDNGTLLRFSADCTHPVYSPTLYAPVWFYMWKILTGVAPVT